MKIHFVSSNVHKIREVEAILKRIDVEVIASNVRIEEIQTENVEKLVRDKLLKAFSIIGRPVFVEHTGLHLKGLNGIPGGLTQIFWDRLEADRFANLVNSLDEKSITAKTTIGYCDARRLHFFEGEIHGSVPATPAGNRDFQWDCVFIPEGHSKTFAELGDEKNEISMRRRALDKFFHFLQSSK